MNERYDNLATNLKDYREKASLTQEELADRLDVSRQTVISLESGKCIPSVALAVKIARFFELPVEFIFRFQEDGFKTLFDEISNIEEDIETKKGGEEGMVRELMPWSPWREMMSLRENMDKFFDEPFTRRGTDAMYHPAVSIRETKNSLIIEADIPGVKDEDIDVEIEDDKVILRGERKHKEETKREDYYHMESSYGAFSRIITLPAYVDADRAEAQVKDGILEVVIPKVELKKAKKLSIKSPNKSIESKPKAVK